VSLKKGGPSTEPLSENEERALRTWIERTLADPRADLWHVHLAKVTAIFYYTGMHPAVLADPLEFNLRCDGDWIRWNRAKTRKPILFPLIPELRPWFQVFLRSLGRVHPITYNRYLHEAARLAGLVDLTPRACRHTRAAVLMERTGFNTARDLTGVTDTQLVDYGKRAASRADLQKLLEKGFS
jgi:integrase